MNRRACLLLLSLLLLGLAPALRADDHPNTARGFAADKAFASGDVDNVNLFNGNLTLTIPIGGAYPVGGAFSYGLTLVYNSSVWDFQEVSGPPATYQQSRPQRTSNAGLGWQLSLGRLMAPFTPQNETEDWLYIGKDGSEHVFYATLHAGDTDEQGDTQVSQSVSYTRDGSYLRMKVVGGVREIEFPSGEIHRFDSQRRVDQMRDRFGNAVNVAYSTAGVDVHDVWTLTDTKGRVQKVIFATLTQDEQLYQAVSRVELTSFTGTAAYTFNYESRWIARGCPHTDPNMSTSVQVMLLTSIDMPEGLSYQMPVTDYITDQSGAGPGCRTSGLLEGLRLPTWGRLEWAYGDYTFPAEGKLHRRKTAGVLTRRTANSAGTVVGIWTYATSLTGTFPNHELKNSLTDPLGNRTERWFMAVHNNAAYSLPFDNFSPSGDKYLSTKTFDASNALKRSTYVRYEMDQLPTPTAEPQDTMNVNRRELSSHTVFDDDAGKFADVTRSDFDGMGHYRTETTAGNFNAGDIRATTVAFNPTRGRYEINPATNLPSGNHTFTMWPADNPSTPAPLDGPAWILGMYDYRRVDEDRTEINKYCFNADKGFLEQRRTLYLLTPPTQQNPTPHDAHDLLAVFTVTGGGDVDTEKYYGGDAQSIPTTACSTAGLPSPVYQVNHGYSNGVRNSSQYVGTTFLSLDQTINPASGLASSSRDTAGIQTDYEYDALGRLKWVKPQGGDGYTEYVYTAPISTTSLANVLVKRHNNSTGGTLLAQNQVFFDAFGRVWREKTLLPVLPANSWNLRETLYDNAGHRASVSETQAESSFNASKKTSFLNYDAFGRPTIIRPADGSTHDVTYNYYGTRLVERTVKVRTAVGGAETPALTTETYDRQGRLWKVTEPSGAGGAQVTTTYSYDAGNRLKQAQTTSGVTQNRYFTYDVRGLLTSEQHPEKGGTSGNGQVTYSNYDARGHALCKLDGPNRLRFAFDSAERLTAVSEANAQCQPTLLLKSFTYSSANSGVDKSRGKLVTSRRANYPFFPDLSTKMTFIENYTYAEYQGRVSKKQTQLESTTPAVTEIHEAFDQVYRYTRLGDVEHIDYPLCTYTPSCPAATSSPRSVDFVYTNGGLTSIAGYVNSITYHPNGLYNQITHTNGVVDTQTNDPNSIPRPGSFSAQRTLLTPNLWSSGTYAYDGAGNVTGMGNSYFLYDRVSRVVDGHVYDGPTGGGILRSQTYAFDAFGNLTPAIGGDAYAPGRSTPVDASTNRSTGNNVLYDTAGNQTQGGAPSGNCGTGNPCYEYDQFNMMRRMRNSGEDWRYMYDADDERVWSYRMAPAMDSSLWALRDLDGKVLREYDLYKSTKPARDYVYRNGQLVATAYPDEGVRHVSLDHLGTPRLITAPGGHTRSVWTGGDSSCAPAPADYDHDGDADLALLCGPAWHFYNDDGSYKGGIWTGASTTYTPVPADYDGDGYVDVANFDSGAWHIWNYATQAYHGVWTGTGTGCIPAPGDYDGDGNADFALKCGPYWHFYNDNGSFARSIWTGATDAQLPVQGDYNGDGRTDLAVSNGAAWDIFDSISGAHTAGVWTGNYGTPVPMDYDGDGTTDVVVFTAGGWHVYRDDGGYDQGLWTAANTTPMHANFTGDRTEEPAIYSNGAWIIYSFAGMPVARHHYFPFGDELSSIRQDVEQMKLTGHERDLGLASSADDDLDYMHARHYNPIPGRFLAVDRHLGNPRSPQSWNRYCYAADNPLKYIDPDGESATAVWGGVAGGAEITGAAAVAGSAVAAAGVGIASWELGRWIGGVPVGDGSIDSHISDAMAAGILLFSKSKGGGRDSEFINHTVDDLLEELEAAKKAKDTERVQRIIRELKNRGHRNQGKARGGRREPKKGGNNSFIIGAYDSGSDSQLFNLFTAWELEQLIRADMSLDEERAAACGVGVSCPF